jgi:hypothetical protein
MVKLQATNEKVTIQWFAVLSDGSKVRNNAGFQHNAWEVKCSCGWETATGGAVRSYIKNEVDKHKRFDHNYEWAMA